MFRTNRTCNPKVEFSKYKFINKLLDGVTLLKVTPGVTRIQPYIYIYIYIYSLTSKELHLFIVFDSYKI